ncbi:hypothetical protein ACQP1W_44820 [Spirillospora sp. CA-255316]
MSTIKTAVRGTADQPILRVEFPVNYAHFFLLDGNNERTVHPAPGAPGETHAGIIRAVRGGAYLTTGLFTGVIDLTVAISGEPLPPLADEYEDVVEVSLQIDTENAALVGWSGSQYVDLPHLPAGAGWYRLRYHAKDMDRANDLVSETPLDSYLLQIWPQQRTDPVVIKVTSQKAHRKLAS